MNAIRDWREFTRIQVDGRAIGLVTLFVIVIAGALALRPVLVQSGVESAVSGSSSAEQAGAGLVWGVAEAVFALGLLALIFLWRKLPEWLQDVIETDIVLFMYMVGGAVAFESGAFWTVAGIVLGVYTVLKLADEFDVWWIVNNVLAVAIAIVAGAGIGIALGPWVLGFGLVALAVYDHWFANKKTWMFTLGSAILNWKLPVLFVVPSSLRMDWDELVSQMGGEESDEADPLLYFGIGSADLILPAGFVVALAGEVGVGIVAMAVAAGVFFACFRLSWLMTNKGSGAGLPSLTSGALGGWAVGAVVVMLV